MLSPLRLALFSLSLAALMMGTARADFPSPLTIVHAFDVAPEGAYPSAPLVQGLDGNFYGTTSGGVSSNGSIFKITPDGVRTTLVTLDGFTNGANPNGLCLGTDGNFYGTTKNGGFYNLGSVFKITPDGELTLLFSFSGSDGAWPVAGLTLGADGNFYGTTYNGGSIGDKLTNLGTVFKITPTGELTTLHAFYGYTAELDPTFDGYNPSSTLLLAQDGNFYGVTPKGGDGSRGTVFRISPAGDLQTLLAFGATEVLSDLTNPYSALVQDSAGFFYGTASGMGMIDGGIYRMSLSGAPTLIYGFSHDDENVPASAIPNALILGGDGNFYGTAQQSFNAANGQGTVFKMTPDNKVSILTIFTGANGSKPTTSLVQGTDGNFYGSTWQGGSSNVGTIFKITPAGTLTSLSSFATLPAGSLPKAPLLLAQDGNFYGTTERGGSFDAGTAFQVSPSGDFTSLATFTASTGAYPSAKLIQALDGNFYGTTSGGGETSLNGSVFQMTSTGSLNILATFPGAPGIQPNPRSHYPDAHTSELIQGPDGNFYGANYPGGTGSPGGRIFKVGPSLPLANLAYLDYLFDTIPYAGLTLGTDGKFYAAGNSPIRGISRDQFGGQIFSMTVSGHITDLVDLNRSSTGRDPSAAMLLGADGNFYGTMATGGAKNMGTIYKVTPLGVLTTLATFDGDVYGKYPRSGLILGQDGKFYGTTAGDPANNDFGTIFSFSIADGLTTLYRFSSADGSSPLGLVQHPDGTFYGVTTYGGPAGAGEIFNFNPVAAINFPPIANQLTTSKVKLAARTTTGAPVKFNVVSGPANVSSNLVSFTGSGRVTVQASQSATTGSVALAAPETRSFSVQAASQSITFPAVGNQIFSTSPISVQATASSKLPVTYTATGAASVIDGTVRMTGTGKAKVTATQAGDSVYAAAAPVSVTFSIAKGPQTISFPLIPGQAYGSAPVTLGATASSGLPITYSIDGPAKVSGNLLTTTGVGAVTVTARQGGNENYNYAPAVKTSFKVGKGSQIITFPAIPAQPLGTPPITLAATASSGLPVVYSVTGPGTLSGNVLTLTGMGSISVTARQGGNGNYNYAPAVKVTFVVGRASQTVTFGSIPPQTFGAGPLTMSAVSSSGLPLTYTVTGPGKLSANVLTITGAGLIVVTASQKGSDLYAAASAQITVVVNKAAQTVTFPAVGSKTSGGPGVVLAASASSGLPITYSVESGPATVSGNVLTLTGAGRVTVQAVQPGNTNYNAAAEHIRFTVY